MRFLKNKIRLAEEAAKRHTQSPKASDLQIQSEMEKSSIEFPEVTQMTKKNKVVPQKKAKGKKGKKEINPTKNIVINYGNAMASFALSKLAVPYLQSSVDKGTLDLQGFIEYLSSSKGRITGVEGLKSLLLITEEDNEKVASYKLAFKMLCEIFIKYFSVNWIIHGRVTNKLVYLKYRTRVLVRVQNPEQFTYIKEEK